MYKSINHIVSYISLCLTKYFCFSPISSHNPAKRFFALKVSLINCLVLSRKVRTSLMQYLFFNHKIIPNVCVEKTFFHDLSSLVRFLIYNVYIIIYSYILVIYQYFARKSWRLFLLRTWNDSYNTIFYIVFEMFF